MSAERTVAVWVTVSAAGTRVETLTAGGRVHVDCPRAPRVWCQPCGGCAACGECSHRVGWGRWDVSGAGHSGAVTSESLWVLFPVVVLAVLVGRISAGRRPSAPSAEASCGRACCSASSLDRVDHREFEFIVRDLLRRDGCVDAERVGGAGDNGADVLATDPFGRRWVIQCKHRAQGRAGAPVGVRDLQVLNGTGRPVHKGDIVVLVTNSGFTKSARRFGHEQRLQLLGRALLEEWVDQAVPVWTLLNVHPALTRSAP